MTVEMTLDLQKRVEKYLRTVVKSLQQEGLDAKQVDRAAEMLRQQIHDAIAERAADGTVDEFPQLARKSNITKLCVKGDFGGAISARNIKSLQVKDGSLSGDITLSDELNRLIVRNGDFTGTVTASRIDKLIVKGGQNLGTVNLV